MDIETLQLILSALKDAGELAAGVALVYILASAAVPIGIAHYVASAIQRMLSTAFTEGRDELKHEIAKLKSENDALRSDKAKLGELAAAVKDGEWVNTSSALTWLRAYRRIESAALGRASASGYIHASDVADVVEAITKK